MPLKTYESIGILNRYISAHIDGRDVSISFRNGTSSPRAIQGHYTTSDHKIQEYLETSGNFNKKYRLVAVVMTAEEKLSATDPQDDMATGHELPNVDKTDDDKASMSVPEETDEDILAEPTTKQPFPLIVGEEVVNGQQARNYLIKNFKDLTFRQVINNAQIIAEAKARGVQFTHWETFVT